MPARLSRGVPVISALILCLLASSIFGTPLVHAQVVSHRNHSPSLPRLGSPLASPQGAAPNYDEQIGLTFTDTLPSLKYNVTAISQDNTDGYGPAYLLNGLTDKGYWYQVGLSWDWSPGTSPGTGFNMNYEAWDTNGLSVFPTDGSGGLSLYSGNVNPGDKVELSLTFSNGTVVMSSRDLNTGAAATASYNSKGATTFNGLINPSDPNGYFSGLMTEEYHSSPYFGNVLAVTYSSSTPLSNGWLWVDEFGVAPRSPVFYGSKFVSFLNPSQVQTFARNGTTEYVNSTTFVTGALNEALLTLSYSVSGGGTGLAAPVLTYEIGGVQKTATLTETPTTFFADAGSNWEVANELHGSTTAERWATNKQTSGTLSTSMSEGLVFYHQYLCTFHYTVAGGGSGYSPPAVNSTVFGTSAFLAVDTSVWVDSGSPFKYASSLPGSSSTERWMVQMLQPGLVAQPGSIVVSYYHQYSIDMAYVVIGGGSPAAPTFSGRELGATLSLSIFKTNSFFLDTGTSWSVSPLLSGSASKERWTTTQITNGTVSGPANLSLSYRHQYMVAVAGYPREGGSTSQPTTWEDVGGTVQIFANASRGWKFEGLDQLRERVLLGYVEPLFGPSELTRC